MKKIFITGVSGLLGTNLVHYLLEKEYKIIGLVRKKESYKGKLHANLTLKEGTLFGDFIPLLKEVDYVIHIAAITAQNISSYDPYRKINFEASKQLFLSAKLAGVNSFVFVSSANTMGNGTINFPGNEEKEVLKPFSESFYAKSKRKAEEYLIRHQNGINLTIINPCFMIGAYDSKPSSGKIILRALNKSIIFHPKGGKCFVHVKDVCAIIGKAMHSHKSGEKYLVGNENMTYRTFYKKLLQISEQEAILLQIPNWVLLLAGYFGNFLRWLGYSTSLSSTNMKMLFSENYYSNQKSIQEFKIAYHPIEEGTKEAVNYFKQND